MAADEVQYLDLKDLDSVLARAKAEGWAELTLVYSKAFMTSPVAAVAPEAVAAAVKFMVEHLVRFGWSAAQVFVLERPIQDVPNLLIDLAGLTSLNLRGNAIGDAQVVKLARLCTLTRLDLSHNCISEAGAKAVASLSCLTSLDLGGNQIGDAGAAALASLTYLTALNLENNRMSAAGAAALAQLGGLTSLNLAHSQIGDAGAIELARLKELTSLELGGNLIGDRGAAALAQIDGLRSLNLASNQIGNSGAAELAHLHRLANLHLGSNQIGDAGATELALLKELTSLDLGSNLIGDRGATELALLKELTSLDLGSNLIGDRGAAALAQLHGLTSLNLQRNQIGDMGASALAQLNALSTLRLQENQIGDAGAVDLARLSGLTTLNLWGNQIGEAGARAIFEAWADPATAERRQSLDLRENGDLGGPLAAVLQLPSEVLQQTDAQALIAAWRRFRDSERRPLNEAKLIVVGEGNVGKTSLVRYMTTGKPRKPTEPATEGVRAYERIETAQWTPEGSPFTLNIWDFGGQEMYFGTHRYFLTARSLYLLVLDDRTDKPDDAERWLRRIRSHATDAPVIVVTNKAGEAEPGLRLDEAGLMKRHGPIVAFLRTSCEPGSEQPIAALKAQIVATLADAGLMPDVHQGYPEPWWQVKDALAAQARDARIVDAYAFRRLCEANGIDDENEQRGLLRTLHELGTVVTHGLSPEARAVHRETMLLDPNWLTQASYAILGSSLVREQNGEFVLGDLGKLLDPAVYPERLHELIVALMLDEKLGLCLALDGQRARYLLPAALPPSVPELGTGACKPCRRYRYNTLPGDLMPRLMVQARDMIAAGSARWRDGVVLTVHGCSVMVRTAPDPVERRIDVAVYASGDGADPRRALDRIEEALARVHGQFGEIGVKAFVPLPDVPEEDVELRILQRLDREGTRTYRRETAVETREYPVAELLSGVREAPATEAEQNSALGRFLAWLETWPGTAAAASSFIAIAALVLLPMPWREWDQKAAWAVVIAVVTYLLVRRSDPELIYRRLLWLTVPGSLAMLLLGASFQVGIWTPDAFVHGQVGAGSIWAPVVAVVAVTSILAAADICLMRLRRAE